MLATGMWKCCEAGTAGAGQHSRTRGNAESRIYPDFLTVTTELKKIIARPSKSTV